LPPPELAIEAFIAGAYANAPGELEFIHAGKDFLTGFPVG
jgi:hypothetical protein